MNKGSDMKKLVIYLFAYCLLTAESLRSRSEISRSDE